MELNIDYVHESVVSAVVAKLDLRSKCSVMCTCRSLYRILSSRDVWRSVVFEHHEEQHGLDAENLVRVIARSAGSVEVIHLSR